MAEANGANWKISADDLPAAISQLNCGQSAEVVNGEGVPLRLWTDPKRMSLRTRPSGPLPPPPKPRPIFCPQCNAVLKTWGPDEREQTCLLCGHVVVLD